MSRAGSISGVVLDDRGEPIVNAYVRVLSRIPIGGEPQLAAGSFARTDDRGAYRIAGLPRGTYYVQMPSVQNAFSAATTDTALAGTVPFDLSLAASTGRAIAFARKSDRNLADRGFDFEFATQIFDGRTLEREDTRRDYGQRRVIAIGMADDIALTVVYTDRAETGGVVVRRIIPTRKSHRHERKAYTRAIAAK